jgi:hypothetical protein
MYIIRKVLNQIICVWNELVFPIFHVMELVNMLDFLCLAMGFRVEGKVALVLVLEYHGCKQLLNYKR